MTGAHGKTFLFVAFDEIHGYELFEALAPDPTRRDALTWITSYNCLRHSPGIPLYDLMQAGKCGDDPRMFFSWYGGDFTTDPAFAELSPEERANPSMASWGDDGYLSTQRRRLPTHRFRRLHLNLPGAPDGAAFRAEAALGAIVSGRRRIPPQPGREYFAFVDMSGGSSDDAVLAIAHLDKQGKRSVLDLLIAQTGRAPFNPRAAVAKFVALLREYGLSRVTGDAYAGQTFQSDFAERGITYSVAAVPKADFYDRFEPIFNAGAAELLDVPELQEQLLTLVLRGAKIDHQPGDHDDYANAAAGAISLAGGMAVDYSAWISMWNDMGAHGGKITTLGTPEPTRVENLVGVTARAASKEPSTVTLHAKPFAQFQIDTVRYASDGSGLVSVAPEHVEAMVGMGCWEIRNPNEGET